MTPYKKRPPGSDRGSALLSWPCSQLTAAATSDGAPPAVGTWKIPTSRITNKMRPSLDQEPPQYTPGTPQIFETVPRDRSTRSNAPLAPNAIDLASGDQNGRVAPSLPGINQAFVASNGRTHNPLLPCATPMKAADRPSGEI